MTNLTGNTCMTEDCLWTVEEVAHFLKLSVSWVRHAAQRGDLPSLRLTGRPMRFEPATIRAWARGECKQPKVRLLRPRSQDTVTPVNGTEEKKD